MSNVKLSDGTVVEFTQQITRKAEKAYLSHILEAGDDGITTKEANDKMDEAHQAIFPYVILSIKKGDNVSEYSDDWLDNIYEVDYISLVNHITEMHQELTKKREELKKNVDKTTSGTDK